MCYIHETIAKGIRFTDGVDYFDWLYWSYEYNASLTIQTLHLINGVDHIDRLYWPHELNVSFTITILCLIDNVCMYEHDVNLDQQGYELDMWNGNNLRDMKVSKNHYESYLNSNCSTLRVGGFCLARFELGCSLTFSYNSFHISINMPLQPRSH